MSGRPSALGPRHLGQGWVLQLQGYTAKHHCISEPLSCELAVTEGGGWSRPLLTIQRFKAAQSYGSTITTQFGPREDEAHCRRVKLAAVSSRGPCFVE